MRALFVLTMLAGCGPLPAPAFVRHERGQRVTLEELRGKARFLRQVWSMSPHNEDPVIT